MTRPDWLPILRRAGGIVTDGGGITCHAAIVGRELGKPVVVGARTATTDLHDGQLITVDGNAGVVFDGAVHTAERPAATTSAPATSTLSAETVTATAVYVNLATPDAAEAVAATDVDGVGLLRAEFMITEALAGEHPSHMIAQGRRNEYVEKMAGGLARIAAAFAPRPVVYRAIDLRSNEFADLEGGEVEPHEENPMIGYRGCFRYIRDPELFSLDLDVLHRVRSAHPNVHLMIRSCAPAGNCGTASPNSTGIRSAPTSVCCAGSWPRSRRSSTGCRNTRSSASTVCPSEPMTSRS